MQRAFHTRFHHFAGNFVRFVYIAVKGYIIRRTPAAAMIFCKTVLTFFFGVKVCVPKNIAYFFVYFTVVNVAHFIIGTGRELVAGENIAVRRYGKVFVTRAARGNALF